MHLRGLGDLSLAKSLDIDGTADERPSGKAALSAQNEAPAESGFGQVRDAFVRSTPGPATTVYTSKGEPATINSSGTVVRSATIVGGGGGLPSPYPVPLPNPNPTPYPIYSSTTAAQIAAMGPSVANLTTSQIEELTPSAVSGFTASEIPYLSPSQIGALGWQAATLRLLSDPAKLASLTPSAISALSPAQMASISDLQLGNFSSSQVAALSTSALNSLTAAQVYMLGSNTSLLSAAQLQSLTTAAVSGLRAPAISALSVAQLAALTNNGASLSLLSSDNTSYPTGAPLYEFGGLYGLTPLQVGFLSPSSLGSLSAKQIGALSSAGVSGLTGAQIAAIGSNVAGFTSTQVSSLTTWALGSFTAGQISSLSSSAVSGLTAPQLESLTTAQFAAFTGQQIAALTPAQVSALGTNQIADMSIAQFAALTGSQVGALTNAQLAALPIYKIKSLSATQLQGLSTTQLSALSSTQQAAFSDLQYASLSSSQRAALSVTNYDDTFTSIGDFTAIGENTPGTQTVNNPDGSTTVSLNTSTVTGSASYNSAGVLLAESLTYSDGNVVTYSASNGYSEVQEKVGATGLQTSQINTMGGVYATTQQTQNETGYSVYDSMVMTTDGPAGLEFSVPTGEDISSVSAYLEAADAPTPNPQPVPIVPTPTPQPMPTTGPPDPPAPGWVPPTSGDAGDLAIGVALISGGASALIGGAIGALLGFGASIVTAEIPADGTVEGWEVWDGSGYGFVPDGQITVDLSNGTSETIIGTETQDSNGSLTITETIIEN